MITKYDINILGKNYIFLGIDEAMKNTIQQQAELENFKADLELWGQWMQKLTGDESIVVCDPYRITEIPEEFTYIEKANKAAEELTKYIGGKLIFEKNYIGSTLVNMFENRGTATIYGMQYSRDPFTNTSVGSFGTMLFIDFELLERKKAGLALPIIMHETTHYLEGMQFKDNNNRDCFGDSGILAYNVNKDELWGVEKAGSLWQDPNWKNIFEELQRYQRERPQERMTSLIEKMTIGSLYEFGDREWVEKLKDILKNVLKEGESE